jgi:hypothetical protein
MYGPCHSLQASWQAHHNGSLWIRASHAANLGLATVHRQQLQQAHRMSTASSPAPVPGTQLAHGIAIHCHPCTIAKNTRLVEPF